MNRPKSALAALLFSVVIVAPAAAQQARAQPQPAASEFCSGCFAYLDSAPLEPESYAHARPGDRDLRCCLPQARPTAASGSKRRAWLAPPSSSRAPRLSPHPQTRIGAHDHARQPSARPRLPGRTHPSRCVPRFGSLAQRIADWITTAADYYEAAAMYEQLSRLSDAELTRRGLSRATLALGREPGVRPYQQLLMEGEELMTRRPFIVFARSRSRCRRQACWSSRPACSAS